MAMGRKTKSRKKKRSSDPTRLPPGVPPGLRGQLETARLDLLALFRALDQLLLAQSQPDELYSLFELDADFAEALWALDQPPGALDFAAMTRDTRASLGALPDARRDFLEVLTKPEQRQLSEQVAAVRKTMDSLEAYNQVPGRDPQAG